MLSHLYSFSFEPNYNWSREYPGQEEILQYLIQIAHKYGLYDRIRFNTQVEEARWDDKTNKWHTTVKYISSEIGNNGQTYTITSDFLVAATGQLSTPKYPDIKGLSSFQGKVMHSARWDWNYDWRGKRVGIIGTGATAAQIIPEMVGDCERLVVFQRTPTWVVPRHDQLISLLRQTLYKFLPYIRKRYRATLMDVREAVAEALFQPESARHDVITNVSRQHLLDQLPGESNAEMREALTPNYPFSCKRIVVSDSYYPALRSPNLTLDTNAISKITSSGVCMADKARTYHELDLLVLATGFRTTDFMFPIRIYGTGGRSLSEIWSRTGPTAYLGITVEGLPNFGMLYGPNSGLAHNSLILQIEAQSLYINSLIAPVLAARRRGQSLSLEPKPCVMKAYNTDLQRRLASSTFAHPGCTSWFKDEQGRITNNWSGSAIEYQKRVNFVDWSDFLVGGSGKALIDSIPGGVTRWNRCVEETQVSDAVLLGMAAASLTLAVVLGIWWRWGLFIFY